MITFSKLLIFVAVIICSVLVPIGLVSLLYGLHMLRHGYTFPHRKYPSVWHSDNIFKKLFWLFPKAVVNDIFTRNPDAFPMDKTGLVIFEGKQGSGKSVGAVFYMDMLKKQYPKLSIMSNIHLSLSDYQLDDWHDIVFKNNGEYGQVVFLDEIQNYFNSMESKNFPPEMLQEVCQQRKQRKTIIGTTQVFGRVAKPIREQVSILVRPRTILGCLTILSMFDPSMDTDGQVTKLRRIKTHIFVHTPELRNAYDTFEKVERHALYGFKPRSELLTAEEKPH